MHIFCYIKYYDTFTIYFHGNRNDIEKKSQALFRKTFIHQKSNTYKEFIFKKCNLRFLLVYYYTHLGNREMENAKIFSKIFL